MARLHLEFADDALVFTTQLDVRTTDINSANHLSNEGLIAMVSEARARFLQQLNIAEGGVHGMGILITDLATVYQAEAFFGDCLNFAVGVADFNRYGGDIVFRITRQAQPVALAKCGFVFFDYPARKVTPMPEAFRLAVASLHRRIA